MEWPQANDFRMMLQDPKMAFKDEGLKQCRIEKDTNGQPMVSAGGFANVYKAMQKNGEFMAVRVFTKNSPNRREHYEKISEFLATLQRTNRFPKCLVKLEYRDKEILSPTGKRWPLVTMSWVSGVNLNHWVASRCKSGDKSGLRKASEDWIELLKTLRAHDLAHCDLQHGNVMVTPQNEFRLVDYDGMCVPKLVGKPNLELGLPPYQHPKRNAATKLSPHLDNFSGILIYVALRALAERPELWVPFVTDLNNENLLFTTDDWERPKYSKLYKELRASRDMKVKRMVETLFGVLDQEAEAVPSLLDLLDPYDEVVALLNQKVYDDAVEMLERQYSGSLPNPPAAPADAPKQHRRRIEEGRARVECRRAMEQAVQHGDEQSMSRLYRQHLQHSPRLLDDYPRAHHEHLTQIAKDAERVLPLLSQLKQALEQAERFDRARQTQSTPAGSDPILEAKPWRQFVAVWANNLSLLRNRKSAQQFQKLAENWYNRNRKCDEVIELWNSPNRDLAKLDRAWNQLGPQGHPETDCYHNEIEQVLKLAVWEVKIRRLLPNPPSRPASQAGDKQLLATWEERPKQTEAAWIKQHVVEAVSRLKCVKCIASIHAKGLSAGHLTESDEESILTAADGLPMDEYQHDFEERVVLAHRRIKALTELNEARSSADVSDLGLACAWEELHAVEGLSLISDVTLSDRVQIARQRAQILRELPDLSLPLQERDRKLLKNWDKILFAKSPTVDRCYDADQWRSAYDDAVTRRGMLRDLKFAVDNDDWPEIARVAFSKLLKGFSFPPAWKEKIQNVRKRFQRAFELRNALRDNDREEFVRLFHAQSVRLFPQLFQKYKERIREWVVREILPLDRLDLRPAFGSNGQISVDNNRCTLHWEGPKHAYTEECVVAVCRREPQAGDDPRQIPVEYRQPQNKHKPGGMRLRTNSKWDGCFVAVWAYVDLGFDKVRSDPLILGRLEI